MAVRILIADDHGVMRAGLRALLEDEPDIEVMGEAENGEKALQLATRLLPDIILLDIGMPGMDGIEVTRCLKQELPQVQVLILTVYEDESLIREAIAAGASGFILKRAAEEELIGAIHAVRRGDLYIHPAVTRFLFQTKTPAPSPKKGSAETLTPREVEVMKYIIRGYTNRQIAENLYISVRTVEGHRASLFGKLGVTNRVELIEAAEAMGLKE